MNSPRRISIAESISTLGYAFPFTAYHEGEASALLARYRAYCERLSEYPILRPLHGMFKPHLLASWADEIVHAPALLDVIEQVLGPNLLVWSTDVFVRPPVDCVDVVPEQGPRGMAPNGLNWHQDSRYLGLAPLHATVRAWIALTGANTANGTMRFVPRSHRRGECQHVQTESSSELLGEYVASPIDQAAAVPVELCAGQFSLHHLQTIHDSGKNTTDEERVCVSVTFAATHVHPVGGADSAMLVRGHDRYGNFDLEPRPRADFAPEAVEAYFAAMSMRMERIESLSQPNLFGGVA